VYYAKEIEEVLKLLFNLCCLAEIAKLHKLSIAELLLGRLKEAESHLLGAMQILRHAKDCGGL